MAPEHGARGIHAQQLSLGRENHAPILRGLSAAGTRQRNRAFHWQAMLQAPHLDRRAMLEPCVRAGDREKNVAHLPEGLDLRIHRRVGKRLATRHPGDWNHGRLHTTASGKQCEQAEVAHPKRHCVSIFNPTYRVALNLD
jgi:hypothetical protein